MKRWLSCLTLLVALPIWPGVVLAHDMSHAMAASPAVRVIDVRMDDSMRFHPDRIEVKKGETVRLRVTNAGHLEHELVVGNMDELVAHAEEMRQHPGMSAHHHDGNAVSVQPGAVGELTGTFAQDGTLDFACLLPGHLEAGMKGELIVH